MRAWAALLCVLALAGCGGDEPEQTLPARGLAEHELDWLRETGDWRSSLDRAVGEVALARDRMLADGAARGAFRRALQRVVECGETPRDPPTERLEPAARLLVEACDAYSEAARADERALGGDSVALAAAQVSWTAGEAAVLRANDALRRHLIESPPLPRQTGDLASSRVDERLSDAAGTAVGRPVEVVCWSHADWERLVEESNTWQGSAVTHEFAGYAAFSRDRVHMESVVCRPLARLAYEGIRPESGRGLDQLSFAVTLLTHESEHLVGPGLSEAEVECYAMQRAAETASALGAPRGYARALATRYWEEIYPLVPPAYSTPDCRDGGRLDLRRDSSVWP